jgi:peptide/nickel transport system substrate-binding protein
MMQRRSFTTLAAAGTLALAALFGSGAALAQQPKTLRVVAHADLKILDPTFTTAYITRNFGYMVYERCSRRTRTAIRSRRWWRSTAPPRTA